MSQFKHRVKTINKEHKDTLSRFPNFAASGSVASMKLLYYGKDAMLVIDGNYIYNVSSEPDIYFNCAH